MQRRQIKEIEEKVCMTAATYDLYSDVSSIEDRYTVMTYRICVRCTKMYLSFLSPLSCSKSLYVYYDLQFLFLFLFFSLAFILWP